MDDTQTTAPATEDDHTQTPAGEDAPSGPPGFSERGRMRRRMRFLRKARELAYRDLGGLVFDLHRFARRNDALVLAKLETIGRIDTELRALQDTLAEHRPVTVLREAGVAACPRCAAIHGSDDRFCPNCGLAMDLRAERPVAGPQSAVKPPAPTPAAPTPTPASAQAMTPTAVHSPAPATPVPSQTATPSPGAAAPAPGPAPPPMPSTAAPAPATPAPATPAPAAPAPAAPSPAAPSPAAPAQDPTPPSGPAPAVSGDPADAEDRSDVDQPTEIVRPPIQSP